MRQGTTTAQHVFVGGEVPGGLRKDALLLEPGELYSRGADDAPGDVVLHGENVLDLGIVGFRPEEAPGRGLGQFDVDANAIAGAANAALEQVARIEQAADLGRRGIRALELKARRFAA